MIKKKGKRKATGRHAGNGEFTGMPISIRLSEEDHKLLRAEMKRRGLSSVASFVRALLRTSQEQPITKRDLDAFKREILKELRPGKKRSLATKR